METRDEEENVGPVKRLVELDEKRGLVIVGEPRQASEFAEHLTQAVGRDRAMAAPKLQPPESLTVIALTGPKVALVWSPTAYAHQYDVLRFDAKVGETPGEQAHYIDPNVVSGRSYTYNVIAEDEYANRSEPSPPARIMLNGPPSGRPPESSGIFTWKPHINDPSWGCLNALEIGEEEAVTLPQLRRLRSTIFAQIAEQSGAQALRTHRRKYEKFGETHVGFSVRSTGKVFLGASGPSTVNELRGLVGDLKQFDLGLAIRVAD